MKRWTAAILIIVMLVAPVQAAPVAQTGDAARACTAAELDAAMVVFRAQIDLLDGYLAEMTAITSRAELRRWIVQIDIERSRWWFDAEIPACREAAELHVLLGRFTDELLLSMVMTDLENPIRAEQHSLQIKILSARVVDALNALAAP